MRRSFVLGLAPLLAAMAVAPATAQAEPPEFGRCLKTAAKTGGFSNASCTTPSPGKTGTYEWLPGAANATFTTKSRPGGKIAFEGVNNVRVTCAGETSTGEYTSPKLEEHVVFTFTGCMTQGLQVSSPGAAPGEVVTNPTECELGVLLKAATPRQDKVGLTCAEESTFMWMKWGAGIYTNAEWCLRGWWFFTLASNRMRTVYQLNSRESHGVQYWEKFAEGPPEPLEATFDGGKTWERAALSLHSVQTNEEPIEVNTVL